MLVAIDAVGIREGGTLSVLLELLLWLPRVKPEWRFHVFLLDRRYRQFDDPSLSENIVIECTKFGNSGLGRILWVNFILPKRLKYIGANVLLALANLGSCLPKLSQIIYCQQSLVVTTESRSVYPFFQRIRLAILKFFVLQSARASKAIIVQTQEMKDRLITIEPCLKGKTYVIPSGYRTRNTSPIIRVEKKRLIDKCTRPRLLYISFLRPHKNHITLLHAFYQIVREIPEAQLLLTIEREPAKISSVTNLLKQTLELVDQLRLNNHVVWLGELTDDEVYYVLEQSDLMIFPSKAESFGLPLVEAMEAGCPVAVSDLIFARQVAGPAASYFTPDNPNEMACCVLSLLRSPLILQKLRMEGASRKELYSYEHIARKIAIVLDQSE